MRTEDLANLIIAYFIEKYEVCYNRPLPIEIDGNNYLCKLYLAHDWRPIIIQGEFESDEQFLTYMKKEIDQRRLHTVWFSRLYKELDSIYGETDNTDKRYGKFN